MKSRIIFWGMLLAGLLSCEEADSPAATDSMRWRGSFVLDSGIEIPFTFTWNPAADSPMVIFNGAERIVLADVDVKTKGDSLRLEMPVFGSVLEVHAGKDGWLGRWSDATRQDAYFLPFRARPGARGRFFDDTLATPESIISTRWAARFSPGTAKEYPAVAEFRETGGVLTGTFLTETGDYRYLEGQRKGDSLFLSAFDGAHAFLFVAEQRGDSLVGRFYAGKHWKEAWVAVADPQATLRDANTLTQLRPGVTRLSFSFPDVWGKMMTYPSAAQEGRVVIVQLLGSWCPNCMDETRLLTRWYDQYHEQGLEIIGLAFERKSDTAAAATAIKTMAKRLGVDYPILLASLSADKTAAARALPELQAVLSYPTSIWIDRKGEVRRIHTGFNGPGTGEAYEEFVEEYEGFLRELLEEG